MIQTNEAINSNPPLHPPERALILASVASMIDQFNLPNIHLLRELGYEVDVAANFNAGNTTSPQRTDELRERLLQMGVTIIDIPIPRSIYAISGILQSYRDIRKLCMSRQYSLIHCQSPVGSVVTRLAARTARRRFGTRVICTVHGFHFYRGSSLISWLLFFPIEKLCAAFTDVLLTINHEDYNLARRQFHAGRVEYLPGIGIDLKHFAPARHDEKREDFGLSESDIVAISVGELNENKNHRTAIRALGKLNIPQMHYFIAGIGTMDKELQQEAELLHVNLHLLGYRNDICDLLNMADLFLFPSKREGLSLSLMEAMACELPCIVSAIRGNTDLIDDGKGGYLCAPTDVDAFADSIKKVLNSNQRADMGRWNRKKLQSHSLDNILTLMKRIYLE